MILINESKYSEIEDILKKIPINTIFAKAVARKCMSGGKIWADDKENPKSFYLLHPYGMGLLFGDHTNEKFNNSIREYFLNKGNVRKTEEWVQAYPEAWNLVIDDLIGEIPAYSSNQQNIVERDERLNFKFHRDKFESYLKNKNRKELSIQRVDEESFYEMKGAVVPMKFWDNYEDFNNSGVGYNVLDEGLPVSVAFSAFLLDKKLEIGIETVQAHQKKGLAEEVCIEIINYALDSGLEPFWSCRKGNVGSFYLATKLGFVVTYQLPYYKLNLK